jgi:hypothetical protein
MKNLHLLISASLVNLVFIIGIISFAQPAKPEGQSEIKIDLTSPTPNISTTPTRQIIRKTVIVTITPSSKPPVAPVVNNSTQNASCIVSVDGVRYDVTQVRIIHSGGDIFKCGVDMTKDFWDQHNAGILAQMAKYKI